jgi:hypothetical protein
VRERQDHRREAFRGGVDDRHRALTPRLTARPVAQTTPEVHHLLIVPIDATGSAELAALREVRDERIAHALETGAHRAFDPKISRAVTSRELCTAPRRSSAP